MRPRTLRWSVAIAALCFGCRTATDPELDVNPDPEPVSSLDDGKLTDADLLDGEATIQMRWLEPGGTGGVTQQTNTAARLIHGSPGTDLPVWAVWFRLDGDPESAAFVWFYGDGAPVLSAGVGDLWAMAFDVPALEHGGSNYEVQGVVQVTEVGEDLASGYLEGWAEIDVYDYVAAEPTGERIRIEALAFRKIPAELD
jgi:hypothetical protein